MSQQPITLSIDYAKKTTSGNWTWTFKNTYDWTGLVPGSRLHPPYGAFEMIKLKTTKPLGSVTNNSLDLGLTLDSADFTLTLSADSAPHWYDIYWSDSLPFEIEDGAVKISEVDVKIPDVNFFCATNVLAPGQNIVQVDATMGLITPYDCVLVGQVSPPTPQSIQGFLGQILGGFINKDQNSIVQTVTSHGYEIEAIDFDQLDTLYTPGQTFDVRILGGDYQINEPNIGLSTIAINPISADTVQGIGQSVDQSTGSISFKTNGGTNCYLMTFARQQPASDSQQPTTTISGFTWPAKDPTQKTPFSGQQFYPLVQDSLSSDLVILSNDPNQDWWESTSATKMMFAIGVGLAFVPVQNLLGYIFSWAKTKVFPENQHDQVLKFQELYKAATLKVANAEARKLDFPVADAANLASQAATDYLNEQTSVSDKQTLEAGARAAINQATQRAINETIGPQIRNTIAGYTALIKDASMTIVDGACLSRFDAIFGGKRSALIATYVEKAVAALITQRAAQENKARIGQLAKQIQEGNENTKQFRNQAIAAKEALEQEEKTTDDPAQLKPLQDKLTEAENRLKEEEQSVVTAESQQKEATSNQEGLEKDQEEADSARDQAHGEAYNT
ncbi:Ff.00g065220.m01.CDS01 [Fusarium sp. VM40]|nr:Ff.00g065220.m01.CDS01 [Fusarium sp. VM40]